MLGETATQVRSLLKRRGGECRVDAQDDSLLKQLLGELGQRRQGKVELDRLRQVLYEMAARGLIAVEFASAESDSIVAIKLVAASHNDELSRARAELTAAHHTIADLQTQVQRNAGDVQAAAELALEAEAAAAAATAELAELRQVYDQLVVQHTQASQGDRQRLPVGRSSPITALRAQLAAARSRIEELRAQNKDLAREVKTRVGDSYHLWCGCIVIHASKRQCTMGKGDHPFYPLVVPNMTVQEGQALLSSLIAQHQVKVGKNTAILVTDTTPKPE